jgi:hypothetical protein
MSIWPQLDFCDCIITQFRRLFFAAPFPPLSTSVSLPYAPPLFAIYFANYPPFPRPSLQHAIIHLTMGNPLLTALCTQLGHPRPVSQTIKYPMEYGIVTDRNMEHIWNWVYVEELGTQ